MQAARRMDTREHTDRPDWASALRGRLRQDVKLANRCWFRVGGPADWLFIPEDTDDLCQFMAQRPQDMPVPLIGVGSNLLVRDSGIRGLVIRLGAGFTQTKPVGGNFIRVGAGALDVHVAGVAKELGLGGLEFLCGIPGTIGGAVAMNAGAYGHEIRDVLISAEVVDDKGELHTMTAEQLGFSYRHSALPDGWICVSALLKGAPEDVQVIEARMQRIMEDRELSQPTRARTGGSTFKNPEGHKAWELIDAAGCRGLTRGDAQVSEKHCNFLINRGDASAGDLEALGEEVRERVKNHSGIEIQWEIKRIGEKGDQ